jgi:monoamine oxidase
MTRPGRLALDGYMEGAVRTGRAAAQEALHRG